MVHVEVGESLRAGSVLRRRGPEVGHGATTDGLQRAELEGLVGIDWMEALGDAPWRAEEVQRECRRARELEGQAPAPLARDPVAFGGGVGVDMRRQCRSTPLPP